MMLVVVPVLNQFDVARDALVELVLRSELALICAIDNGSRQPLAQEPWLPRSVYVHRLAANVGNYPVFPVGLAEAQRLNADLIAFLHSDLLVWETGWDTRVAARFAGDPQLGLVGFVGSYEIDPHGGRGLGTMSNFQGRRGSPAEVHGARLTGSRPAAVVDGCAMIFRRTALEAIAYREAFPPHHYYDRLMSAQLLEAGWRILVEGVACDHLGGQTAVQEAAWHDLCATWCRAHGVVQPADGGWELAVYREAERQFLTEYRDQKRLVPCRVGVDGVLRRGDA